MAQQETKPFPWWLAFVMAGLFVYWGGFVLYPNLQALEAGQTRSVRVWQPIALVYNLMGLWAAVAIPFLIAAAFIVGGIVGFRRSRRS